MSFLSLIYLNLTKKTFETIYYHILPFLPLKIYLPTSIGILRSLSSLIIMLYRIINIIIISYITLFLKMNWSFHNYKTWLENSEYTFYISPTCFLLHSKIFFFGLWIICTMVDQFDIYNKLNNKTYYIMFLEWYNEHVEQYFEQYFEQIRTNMEDSNTLISWLVHDITKYACHIQR